jgi:hypothetical protein
MILFLVIKKRLKINFTLDNRKSKKFIYKRNVDFEKIFSKKNIKLKEKLSNIEIKNIRLEICFFKISYD